MTLDPGILKSPDNDAMLPWDDPDQLITFDESEKSDRDLSDWSVYERLNELSAIQEINNATRDAAAVELMALNRENAAIVLCHDPLGTGSNANQNLNSWSETVISDLGFRHEFKMRCFWFWSKIIILVNKRTYSSSQEFSGYAYLAVQVCQTKNLPYL